MKITLTHKETEKIVKKLKDYGIEIIDMVESKLGNIQVVDTEYLMEKINEALEE